jgi:hypothetical protein
MAANNKLHLPIIAVLLLLAIALQAHGQQQLADPDDVRTGLRILNQVVGHTGRLIVAKKYDTVPHEHHEIVEGAEILREALAEDPESFRDAVDGMLNEVVAASSALAEPSKMHDDAKLEAAHAALATAVHKVLDEFPADLQPDPRY